MIPFFKDPFWGVSAFLASYHGCYSFLYFLCGFLIAGVRKTQEDTLKVFIYQKYLFYQKYLACKTTNTGGDRMFNTDRHKIYEFEWRLILTLLMTGAKNMEFTKLLPSTMLYYCARQKKLRPFTLDQFKEYCHSEFQDTILAPRIAKINKHTKYKTTDQINTYSIYSYFSLKYAFKILSNTQITS